MKDGIHSALLVTSLRLQSACGDELSRQPALSNLSDAFPGPVVAYGFTVNFNSSASCQDELAYFTLQESLGGGSRRTIGASSIRWVSGGLRLLTSGVNACAGTSTLSFAPPWPWHLADESAIYLFLSACIPLTAAIFAAAGRPHDAQRAAAAAALAVAMSLFVAVAGFLGTGATSSAFYPAVLLLAHLIVAAPLAASHHRAPEAAMAAAALAMTGRALSDSLVFGDTAYLLARPPVAASMLALLAAALSIRVRAVRADAAAGAATAVAALDSAWAGFAAAAGNPGALEELGALIDDLGQVLAGPPLRQLSLIPPMPAAAAGGASRSGESAVTSLDQLYSQAMCAAPLLLAACTEWAAECGGRLDCATGAAERGPDGPDEALDGLPESLRGWIRARVVKSPQRAAAKAAARYGWDVSRLADVTRCRIVCDDAAALLRGVRAVCSSAVAGIVRVRSTLRDSDGAAAAAGLRAVTVNLCLASPRARRFGVDCHVCEVQLVPAPVAEELARWPHRSLLAARDAEGRDPAPVGEDRHGHGL